MIGIKAFFGIIAVLVAIASYIPYIKNILAKKTKPHAFSWLIWGIIGGIVFTAQITGNAGAGSWVIGLTSLMCLSIFVLAMFYGDRYFVLFDWIALISAFITILIWIIQKNPLIAVILSIVIDIIALAPTLRKARIKPHEETAITYVLAGTKMIFSLLALETYSPTTYLFPAYAIFANVSVVYVVLTNTKKKNN